ncbi:MAG: YitT family protein [Sphingobacteriales bacterium]|nr:MAG: YitT family protein [Sphingobacteriales bacterium]
MQIKKDKINWNEIFKVKHILFNVLGVGLVTFALKGFMIPNQFLDGGVTGISILVHEITHLSFAMLIIIFNIPFLFLANRIFDITFTVQSCISIVMLAVCMSVIHIDAVTTDRLLIALFGGGLIGLGIGFCMRGGSTVDGAEVLAALTIRKIGLDTSEVIFAMNSTLFLLAAYSFGITTALYSIVTYFAAIKALDYVTDGFEHYTSLHIISSKSDEIKELIVKGFGKGITVLKGEKGYLPDSFEVRTECDVVVTIVTRLELLRIKEAVIKLDPLAFIYIQQVKEANGGILSKVKNH